LICYGCGAKSLNQINTPLLVPSPTSVPATKSQTITPSLIPVITPSEAVTPTQVQPMDIVWANNAHPTIIESGDAFWSPTMNAIAYLLCKDSKITIAILEPPYFQPEYSISLSQCTEGDWYLNDEIIWSSDGLSLFYFGPSDTKYTDIWEMRRTNKLFIPLNIKDSLRSPRFISWENDSNLIFWNYNVYGEYMAVDISNKKVRSIASVPGEAGTPNHGYYPVEYEDLSTGIFHILAISELLPEHELLYVAPGFEASGRFLQMPEHLDIPPDRTSTTFIQWMPGTGRMLVTWLAFESREFQEIVDKSLLIWDIRNNTVSEFANSVADAVASVDGTYVAYHKFNQVIIVDGQSNKEFLSLPFPSYSDIYFSSNGQYLTFFTDGEVQVDEKSFPTGTVHGFGEKTYLNLLDLATKRMVVSIPVSSTFVSWAPDTKSLLFYNNEGNLHILDIDARQERAVTKTLGGFILSEIKWSFDGRYALLNLTDRIEFHYSIIISTR
jgi:hypothetical protein